jgi:uncharacterized protein (TIGR00251 family)
MIRSTEKGCTIEVDVKIRAAQTRVVGLKEARLQVAIAAPPVDGAANASLCRTLCKHFGLGRGQVRIVAGEHHRHKRVELCGLTEQSVRAMLAPCR